MVVLDKAGLKITFRLERPPDIADLLIINMSAQNSGSAILTDFLFQAAVPKVVIIFCIYVYGFALTDYSLYFIIQTFQLQMLSPSSTVIPPSGQVSQVLKVTNINKVSLHVILIFCLKIFINVFCFVINHSYRYL